MDAFTPLVSEALEAGEARPDGRARFDMTAQLLQEVLRLPAGVEIQAMTLDAARNMWEVTVAGAAFPPPQEGALPIQISPTVTSIYRDDLEAPVDWKWDWGLP